MEDVGIALQVYLTFLARVYSPMKLLTKGPIAGIHYWCILPCQEDGKIDLYAARVEPIRLVVESFQCLAVSYSHLKKVVHWW